MPIETLRPNAAGKYTSCIPYPSGSENWADVDEAVSDDDSTYVSSPLNAAQITADTYVHPNSSIPDGSTINSVTAYIYARRTKSGYGYFWINFLPSGGQLYSYSVIITATTYTLKSKVLTTNPFTGLPWTIADVNGLQFGENLGTGTDGVSFYPTRCTQSYIEVDYTLPVVAAKKIIGDGIVFAET